MPPDFESLYKQHRDWVVSLAWRLTGDRELALDVLQETFAYVFRKLPDLRLTTSFRGFLYPVVRNASLTAASRRRREPPTETWPLVAYTPDPDRAEALEALRDAVARLPLGQREVLILRFVDELSLSDIAAALDMPVGTVKSRLHNALAALRDDEGTKNYFQS